jgi:hypothetical protein
MILTSMDRLEIIVVFLPPLSLHALRERDFAGQLKAISHDGGTGNHETPPSRIMIAATSRNLGSGRSLRSPSALPIRLNFNPIIEYTYTTHRMKTVRGLVGAILIYSSGECPLSIRSNSCILFHHSRFLPAECGFINTYNGPSIPRLWTSRKVKLDSSNGCIQDDEELIEVWKTAYRAHLIGPDLLDSQDLPFG